MDPISSQNLTLSVSERPKAQIGERCAGLGGILCAKGLSCVLSQSNSVGNLTDQTGICQNDIPKAGAGETCGGIVGIQCAKELECVLSNTQFEGTVNDESGICERQNSTFTQTLAATATATNSATSKTNIAIVSNALMMLVSASLLL